VKRPLLTAITGWAGIVALAWWLADRRIGICSGISIYSAEVSHTNCIARATAARDSILIYGLSIGLVAAIVLSVALHSGTPLRQWLDRISRDQRPRTINMPVGDPKAGPTRGNIVALLLLGAIGGAALIYVVISIGSQPSTTEQIAAEASDWATDASFDPLEGAGETQSAFLPAGSDAYAPQDAEPSRAESTPEDETSNEEPSDQQQE